jgi:RNA polymerase sigma-70 factor (ECF subfamily)
MARLAGRVALGDRAAFLELYDLTSPKVYGLALKMMMDPGAAEEVAQETFLKLWTRAETFRPGRGSFMGWLLTITRHEALDRLRRSTRRPQLAELPDPDADWEPLLSDPNSQTDEARWGSLYFAVQNLPAEQRAVIGCAYYHGMSHSQISDYLGVPLGTVKTRLRLGMAKLRQAWLEESSGRDRGTSDAGESDVNQSREV